VSFRETLARTTQEFIEAHPRLDYRERPDVRSESF
jgi:hypothetical protein